MATDKKPSVGEKPSIDNVTRIVEILFILLLIAALMNRLPAMIKSKTGIDMFDISGSYERMTSVGSDSALGSLVRLKKGVEIMSIPGFGRILGFQKEGAYGTLESGPEGVDSKRWWYVNFNSGEDGWVAEHLLANGSISKATRTITALGYALAGILIAGGAAVVVYLLVRINQVRAREVRAMKAALAVADEEKKALEDGRNPRWSGVLANIDSENPNDWRHAIMEADAMLDELIMRMGYRGESLGEKMKQIEKSDFQTIDLAWEAHKVRNQIAHEGGDYILSRRDAKRAIDCFQKVFEEFYYI